MQNKSLGIKTATGNQGAKISVLGLHDLYEFRLSAILRFKNRYQFFLFFYVDHAQIIRITGMRTLVYIFQNRHVPVPGHGETDCRCLLVVLVIVRFHGEIENVGMKAVQYSNLVFYWCLLKKGDEVFGPQNFNAFLLFLSPCLNISTQGVV